MSNSITLKALTAKAAEKLARLGVTWNVSGQVEEHKRDPYFFHQKENYLYLTPIVKPARDPEKDIGANFHPIVNQARIGSMWIAEKNDPDFAIEGAVR